MIYHFWKDKGSTRRMDFRNLTDTELNSILNAQGIDAAYKDRIRAELARRSGRKLEGGTDVRSANPTPGPPTVRDRKEAEPVREYRFNVVPVGKPRQTQRDKWKERPAVVRYREYADRVRAEARRMGFRVPDSGLTLSFRMPMPPSWSRMKRVAMDGQPHRQRPDVDNLCKALLDALMDDDSVIWRLDGLEKRWAVGGCIVATVKEAA